MLKRRRKRKSIDPSAPLTTTSRRKKKRKKKPFVIQTRGQPRIAQANSRIRTPQEFLKRTRRSQNHPSFLKADCAAVYVRSSERKSTRCTLKDGTVTAFFLRKKKNGRHNHGQSDSSIRSAVPKRDRFRGSA